MPVLAATTTYDSFYTASGTVYATIHDAANANQVASGQPLYIGQELQGSNNYAVYRTGLHFNTSTIPSDAAVISATLSLYGNADSSQTDFNLTIVNGSALSNPGVVADYGGLLAATASAGTIGSSSWILSAYNDITLNTVGLGFITKAGTTKLGLKSSRDINSNVPTQLEFVLALGLDETNPAKLTITYASKGNIFVKAANLHYVSYTGVERYILGTAV